MPNRRLITALVTLLTLVLSLAYANMAPQQSLPVPQAPEEASTNTNSPTAPSSSLPAPTPVPPASTPSLPQDQYVVDRVVDGDTIVLRKQGSTEKVRVIGLDTPEVVDATKPVQCYGPEASAMARQLLEGKIVRFESDPSQGTYDVYHRRLGYIFLEDGTNFELYMIENGFGREYTYRKPYAYQKEFKAAQVRAKTAGIGLWSVCM